MKETRIRRLVKKRIKILFIIFILLSTIDCRLSTNSYAASSGFYLGYKLSFYNLFSPEIYAFRRTHQFSFGYQNLAVGSSRMNIDAQYNWIDEVKGSISTHNLTAWVFNVSGTFNQVPIGVWTGEDGACLKYIYFINLLSPWLNRGVVSLEYQKVYSANEFLGVARAGIGFSRKFLPRYGINMSYLPSLNTSINCKFNWLEDSEDNPDFVFKFPLSAGFSGRITSQGSYSVSNIGEGIGLEYVWDPAKSYLVSPSDSKPTNHWLKGFVGDKLWF